MLLLDCSSIFEKICDTSGCFLLLEVELLLLLLNHLLVFLELQVPFFLGCSSIELRRGHYRLGTGREADPENGKFLTHRIDGGLLVPKDKDGGSKHCDKSQDDDLFKGEPAQRLSHQVHWGIGPRRQLASLELLQVLNRSSFVVSIIVIA